MVQPVRSRGARFLIPKEGKFPGNQQSRRSNARQSAHVKNEKQYEALKDKGSRRRRAARIANAPVCASEAAKEFGTRRAPRSRSSQGGTTRPEEGRRPQGRHGRPPLRNRSLERVGQCVEKPASSRKSDGALS